MPLPVPSLRHPAYYADILLCAAALVLLFAVRAGSGPGEIWLVVIAFCLAMFTCLSALECGLILIRMARYRLQVHLPAKSLPTPATAQRSGPQ